MNTFHALSLAFLLVLGTGCKKKEEAGARAAQTTGSATSATATTGSAAAAGSAESGAAGSGSAAGSAAPTGDGIVLRQALPKVGDKATKVHDSSMVMTLGTGAEMTMTKHTEETREILEASGDVFTKAKMTYVAHKQTQAMAGKTKDKPSPLTGKAYIVWRKDGKLEATRDDGSAVPPDELKELLDENKRLGEPDMMDRIVGSKTWKVGEKVVFTPAELAEINKRYEAGVEQIVGLTLTLTGVEAGVATMAMDMAMATKNPKGTMDIAITGTTKVDVATGRLIEAGGTGPVKGDMGMPITGTMTLKTAYTH